MAKKTRDPEPEATEPETKQVAPEAPQDPPRAPEAASLESLAPDPPEPNARALAAEAGSGLSPMAPGVAVTPQGGSIVQANDGTELRHVGGRWFRVDTGAELRDKHGLTFTPGMHFAQEGRPQLSKRGMLCGIGGRNAGKRARARVAHLSGTVEPTIAGAPLPPMASRLADSSSPQAGSGGTSTGFQNQTPFASTGIQGGAPLAPRVGVGSPENDTQAEALAVVLVETLSGTASIMLGSYAAATKPERDSMVHAWRTYLKTVDCSYVPPWALPILASGPYAIRVANEPAFRARLDASARDKRPPDPLRESPRPHVADSEARPSAPAPSEFGAFVDIESGL